MGCSVPGDLYRVGRARSPTYPSPRHVAVKDAIDIVPKIRRLSTRGGEQSSLCASAIQD